jgi:hypothetical protein
VCVCKQLENFWADEPYTRQRPALKTTAGCCRINRWSKIACAYLFGVPKHHMTIIFEFESASTKLFQQQSKKTYSYFKADYSRWFRFYSRKLPYCPHFSWVTAACMASARWGTVLMLKPAMLILLQEEHIRCQYSSDSSDFQYRVVRKRSLVLDQY